MRGFKFRAWDKYQKVMYVSPDEIEHLGSWFDAHLPGATADKKGIVLMQSTDLYDKNGKEIYGGDIVKYKSLKAKIISGYCGFELEWIDGHTNKIRPKTEPIFKNISIIFEVVGNVFENPELLREAEK